MLDAIVFHRARAGLHVRKAAIFLAAICLAAAKDVAAASDAPPIDRGFDRYATPKKLVRLPDERTINLDCRGVGAPTVLLLPGLTSASDVWKDVHDKLAARTRTCSFDPPGHGFSSPSPTPQDAVHIARDLETALSLEKIGGPYIFVGHSAGAYMALHLADRRPSERAGMVLVDPSYPGQVSEGREVAPNLVRFFFSTDAATIRTLERCADRLARGPIPPGDVDAATCFDFRPTYSAELRAAVAAAQASPATMRTKIAHLSAIETSSAQAVRADRDYADMPLIVLTRGELGPPPGPPPPGFPPEAGVEGPKLDKAWVEGHDKLAALSTRGERRTVAGAGHMIPFDRPQAIIDAVWNILDAQNTLGGKSH